MPKLLGHGLTLSNDHLRGLVTLTPVAERLALELTLPILNTEVCPDRGSNPHLPHALRTLTTTPQCRLNLQLFVALIVLEHIIKICGFLTPLLITTHYIY